MMNLKFYKSFDLKVNLQTKFAKTILWILLSFVAIFLVLLTIFHDGNKFITSWNNEYTINITVIAAFCTLLAYSMISYSGTTIQYLSNNPIASPFTIGIIPAATSGLLIYRLSENISQPIFFLLQVVLIIATVFIFLIIDLKTSKSTKIIIALVLSILISTINILVASLYNQYELITIYFSLTSQNFTKIKLYGALIVGLPALLVLIIYKNKIAAYSSSPLRATTLGINEVKMKVISYTCLSLIAAASVIALGPISLVGLLVPNLLRLLGVRNYFSNAICGALVSACFGLLTNFISVYYIIDLFSLQTYIIAPLMLVMLIAMRKSSVYREI